MQLRQMNQWVFDKDYSVNVRKEDINVKLTQIHSMLVAQWESPIPPQIVHICLSASLLTPDMLYSYITDGQHCGESPIYGYQVKPSLSLDASPLSLEKPMILVISLNLHVMNNRITFCVIQNLTSSLQRKQ
jgi:hypothetical protein